MVRSQSTWSDRTPETAAYVNLFQSTARAQNALPGFASMTNAGDMAHGDNFVSTANDNVEADDRSICSGSWKAPTVETDACDMAQSTPADVSASMRWFSSVPRADGRRQAPTSCLSPGAHSTWSDRTPVTAAYVNLLQSIARA